MAEEVDLFVIGAGSGGVRAARIASGYGARVMIAEEYRVGGTCVIRGCVPKKLLVYASRFAEEFEDAAGFGWTVPEPTFDWATLIANKDKEIDRLEKAYTANLERAKVEIVKSRAVIVDPHTVRLAATGETVRAKHILIATGGWPSLGKDIEGLEHVISSNEAFHLKELPKRILIQGGGYIAVEFAGIFNGLGSEVTLVYRGDNILRGFDDDVRNHLRTELEKRGIKVITKKIVEGIEKVDHGLDVVPVRSRAGRGRQGDVRDRPPAQRQGPRPRSRGRQARTDTGAIAVNEFSQTNVPHIYAVGDVTDRIALTPVAIREGHAFADTRVRQQAHAGRPHRRADRGVLRARGRRHRPDRDAGLRAARQGRHLQDHVPADEGDAVGPRHPHLHEARGRRHDRPRGRRPHRRAGRRRDDPAHRHRGEDEGHQGRLRRHHGGASDRRAKSS